MRIYLFEKTNANLYLKNPPQIMITLLTINYELPAKEYKSKTDNLYYSGNNSGYDNIRAVLLDHFRNQ
jgi:hypothetical protein